MRRWFAVAVLACLPAMAAHPQARVAGAPGTVTVPLADYDRLVDRAREAPRPTEAPPAAAVVGAAELRLRVEKGKVTAALHLEGEVYRRGTVKVPLLTGATVTDARLAGRSVPLVAEGGAAVALLALPGPFAIDVDLALEPKVENGVASLTLPAIRAGSARTMIDIPGAGMDVKVEPGVIARRTSAAGRTILEATLEPGRASRVTWTSRESAAAPAVHEARWLSEVKTLITLEEADVRLTALLEMSVLQGQPRQFEIDLPEGFDVVDVSGQTLDSSRTTSARRLELTLTAGAAPRHQFLILLEQPSAAASVRPPFLTVGGAQRETGEVAVEGVGTLELLAKESVTLHRLDVRELSAPLRALSRHPLLAGFRYHRRPSEPPVLELEIKRFPDAAVLAAIATEATVTTLATSQGRMLTEVALVVRNQAQPFLKVGLPPGAQLLSAEVEGEKVKPVQGKDGARVPLLRAGFRPRGPYGVSFVYVQSGAALAKRGEASLSLPRIDIPIEVVRWELFLPDRYRVDLRGGNVAAAADVPVLASTRLVDGVGGGVPGGVSGGILADTISGERVRELPLNGRSTVNLLQLVPGPGQIRGQVVDTTGVPLAGATVTATASQTGLQRYAVTDAQGTYSLDGMPVGPLIVTAELTGFQKATLRSQFKGSGRFDLRLEVGTMTETVEVVAETLNVQTESGSIGRVLEAPSSNVASLQRRVAGVLPVDIDVPREGTSHRFVRALVLDEETTVAFRYRRR